MNHHRAFRLTAIAAAALFASGAQSAPPRPKGPERVVRIDGSNGLLPLSGALKDAWREEAADVEVVLGAGLGGRARLDALASGAIDIALASQGVDAKDLKSRGMTAHYVAVTPVVFGVHGDVTVRDLKPQDVCDIYGGKVVTWAALGGADVPIKPFLRTETDVDTDVVRSTIPCMKGLVSGPSVAVARTTGDMLTALQNTPGAIGLTTTTAVQRSIVALRALSFASVEPTPANVLNGRYALVRPAYLITLSETPPATQAFLAFVRSKGGAEAILAAGALPVP